MASVNSAQFVNWAFSTVCQCGWLSVFSLYLLVFWGGPVFGFSNLIHVMNPLFTLCMLDLLWRLTVSLKISKVASIVSMDAGQNHYYTNLRLLVTSEKLGSGRAFSQSVSFGRVRETRSTKAIEYPFEWRISWATTSANNSYTVINDKVSFSSTYHMVIEKQYLIIRKVADAHLGRSRTVKSGYSFHPACCHEWSFWRKLMSRDWWNCI